MTAQEPPMDAVEAVALTGALRVLAEYGVPPDFQEVLLHGNPAMSIRPGALAALLTARKGPDHGRG